MSTPDFGDLLKQAQNMQEQMMAAQEQVADTEVTGASPQGLVTVRLNGAGVCTGCTIDPRAIDPADPDTLQDLVIAAVNDALDQLDDAREDAQAGAMAGLDLGSLLGGLGNLGGALGGGDSGADTDTDTDTDDGSGPQLGAPG